MFYIKPRLNTLKKKKKKKNKIVFTPISHSSNFSYMAKWTFYLNRKKKKRREEGGEKKN